MADPNASTAPAVAPPQQAPPVPQASQQAPTAEPSGNTPQAGTQQSESSTGGVANSAFARALEDGGYFIDIGPGLTISPDLMGARVNLSEMRQPLPGLALRELRYNRRNNSARVIADINIPMLRSVNSEVSLRVNSQGETSLRANLASELPVFKNKRLQVSLDEQKQLSATLTIEPSDMTPRGASNLEVTGGGSFTLSNGKLSGDMSADFVYNKLGSGNLSARFNEQGRISGEGDFSFEQEFLTGASAEMALDEQGNFTAAVEIPFSDINTPVPGLAVTQGAITFTMDNGNVGGGLNNLHLNYNGLADAVLNVDIRRGMFNGRGELNIAYPELANARGEVRFRNGLLSGSLDIRSSHFPRALRVTSGRINANISETGAVELGGMAQIDLGPAGTGELRASQSEGKFTIGATITLENIPGLQSSEFSVEFTQGGSIEGSGDIEIDETLLPGLSGRLHITYANNLWSGETEIGYQLEEPAVSGNVTIGIEQTEEGTLVIFGSGEITAEIIPGIEGNAQVELDREGDVTLHFAITQTSPFQLFPEYRDEREFINISQNIPLWAGIVVAVMRIRAGARAGVGPGQLRNSVIEGTWKVTGDEAPEMRVSTEFYMPAFVEGYVAFGAGLGLDVVLGSMTGGIEAMATAGLYGAISVVPELSYENENWMFDGTATLAAGARLKLSLNAWAEIEALWVTVWEKEWELASHTMNIGPDLVLSANVSMNLSNPTVPEISFESSDVDHRGLIDSAMPEDGPPGSGAREAVENRAQWQGRQREAGPSADTVPSDLQSQAQNETPAPQAPSRPPRRQAPPNADVNQDSSGATRDSNTANTAPSNTTGASPNTRSRSTTRQANSNDAHNTNEGAQSNQARSGAVPESQVPNTNQARYPTPISLATLDEPPATVPRTAAQQREDLRAATSALNLAITASTTSEDLAAYFPRIRRRFQLTSIGYVEVGDDTKVSLSINPDNEVFPRSILLKGRGIQGRQTEIRHTTGRIPGASDEVGVRMEAPELGPDHPRGSGPRGQASLMDKLVTDPSRPTTEKYIRGHLLNDNIGGEGSPMNLFPITAKANSDHERLVERPVKNWVDQGYWVSYSVTVNRSRSKLSSTNIEENYVTADFICEAAILDMDNNRSRSNQIRQRIHSEKAFAGQSEASFDTSAPLVNAPSIRDVDRNAERERSTTSSSATLDPALKTAVNQALQGGASVRASVIEKLKNVTNMSDVRTELLLRVRNYDSNQLQQLDSNEKGQLSRINSMAANIIAALA